MKYLYNGVKLPALPAYDEGVYSSAVIVRFLSNDGYGLFCSSLPFWVVNANGTDTIALPVDSEVICFTCSAGAGSWQAADSGFDPDPDAIWIYMNPSAFKYVWTHADICREDSTEIIYYGSEPVPFVWQKHFLTGLALGCTGKPLPLGGGVGTEACLYNGLRLRALPEWDTEKYPYAVLLTHTPVDHMEHAYWLCCFSNRPEYDASLDEPDAVVSGGCLYYRLFRNCGTGWTVANTRTLYKRLPFRNVIQVWDYGDVEVIWTNFDILRTDNGLPFFAGSKPEPSDIPWLPRAYSLFSYSGHLLPKLPARNKEEYPYVVVYYSEKSNIYILHFYSTPPIAGEGSDGIMRVRAEGSILGSDLAQLYDGTFEWSPLVHYISSSSYLESVLWANVDISDADNCVRYYKSPDPLLLGEYNHATIQGWIVGKRLAAMRGQKQEINNTARLGLGVLGRMFLGKE